MAIPTGPPILVPPASNYQDFLSHADTYTFRSHYAAVLAPYTIGPAAAAAAPDDVVRLIYAAEQEGVPTALLQWHQGARGKGAHIELLHLVSNYVPGWGCWRHCGTTSPLR